jgi:hypothetical protein
MVLAQSDNQDQLLNAAITGANYGVQLRGQ